MGATAFQRASSISGGAAGRNPTATAITRGIFVTWLGTIRYALRARGARVFCRGLCNRCSGGRRTVPCEAFLCGISTRQHPPEILNLEWKTRTLNLLTHAA